MRTPSLLSLALPSLLLVVGCVADEPTDAGDGEDESGLTAGKADGDEYTTCETDAIVAYLNEGVAADELRAAGVHDKAVTNLLKVRDGADGAFGTSDDQLFASIAAVDAVPWVGPKAFEKLHEATAERCDAAPADIYADARDVTIHRVVFPEGAEAPTDYAYPEGGDFDLGGTEFWQKWSGGHNPTYSFEEGTDAGRRCMQASAIRFETIMANPPTALTELLAGSNWGGSFFNWNDDYSQSTSDGSSARLWAWRTSLIKWISQTNRDGSCYLPTLELVERAAAACKATASTGSGEIQGCSAR